MFFQKISRKWIKGLLTDKISLSRISYLLSGIFLLTNILVTFVPLNPSMPRVGLDPSWVFGVAHATAKQMVFGQDIIFTYGPFSQILTGLFQPDTNLLIIFSSTFLALTYCFAFLCLLYRQSPVWWWISGAVFLCLPLSKDILLFLYPVLIGLIFTQEEVSGLIKGKRSESIFLSLVILLCLPLGLLVLVKGTFLPLCLFILGLVSFNFLRKKYYKMGVSVFLSFLLALLFFWILSGQPINGLDNYFAGLLPIMSGYTEAMAKQGPVIEIFTYLIAALGIILFLFTNKFPFDKKLYLILIFSAYLFLSFKQGFVRHDGHAVAAGTAILTATILAGMSVKSRYFFIVVLLSFFSWITIDSHYNATSTRSISLCPSINSGFELSPT